MEFTCDFLLFGSTGDGQSPDRKDGDDEGGIIIPGRRITVLYTACGSLDFDCSLGGVQLVGMCQHGLTSRISSFQTLHRFVRLRFDHVTRKLEPISEKPVLWHPTRKIIR